MCLQLRSSVLEWRLPILQLIRSPQTAQASRRQSLHCAKRSRADLVSHLPSHSARASAHPTRRCCQHYALVSRHPIHLSALRSRTG